MREYRNFLWLTDTHSTGSLVSSIIADVDQLADGLLMGFSNLFTGVVTIVLTLVFMLQINWKIASVVICITPLSFLWRDLLQSVRIQCLENSLK